MKIKLLILLIVGIVLASAFLVSQLLKPEALEVKELPANYQLSVPRIYTGGGLCYLGSFAMLTKYTDPDLDFSDVVAYGGVGTHAKFISPDELTNGYMEGSIINAARNLGYDLVLAIDRWGTADGFREATKETRFFDSKDEAFSYLKGTIASGIPVEVHLDLYYIVDDFGKTSDHWAKWSQSKRHASHFMVVTGYDSTSIYLNDPGEADPMVNISTTIEHFLQAWLEGANKAIWGARLGPHWMIYIQGRGTGKSTDEIKTWNKQISAGTASEIRKFAESSPSSVNTIFMTELANGRREFAAFLEKTGSDEAATLYERAAELYLSLPASDNLNADLNTIANLEERARQLY